MHPSVISLSIKICSFFGSATIRAGGSAAISAAISSDIDADTSRNASIVADFVGTANGVAPSEPGAFAKRYKQTK